MDPQRKSLGAAVKLFVFVSIVLVGGVIAVKIGLWDQMVGQTFGAPNFSPPPSSPQDGPTGWEVPAAATPPGPSGAQVPPTPQIVPA